ncbi:sigma-70 family RNA polymerase sigma factor [Kribbella jejuensis]|uniref:RNA polymerase sigma-70 factor (ECF subfamily) n=1 Tax=Kribbella jejuensis TaxID=236068 RepID=A0A542DTE3_9ACTN|nr:RNA polymerase sigma factor [Kribbella jejuensis]TQJ06296.1 RNA polymerase sigma-70 factor (ECF subfamily) [Kribbella jejuensis]
MGSAGRGSDPIDGSDQELWERLRTGDQFALGELFDRYADDVRAFAFRRTASWSTADDVVQATFLSTWRRFERNPPGPLTAPSARGWLLVVAGNECRTLARAAGRLRNALARLPGPPPADVHSPGHAPDHASGHAPDHASDVARRVDDELRMSAIRRAVGKLPRHERETLELVVWSGLTTAEAAEALGVPIGTVKARLHRTRQRFPDLLTRVALTEELS